MKTIINILIILLLFPNSTSAQERYKWKYNTIAHRLIKLEEAVLDKKSDFFDKKYKLLDSVLTYTSKKIEPIIKASKLIKEDKSRLVLNEIHKSLTELGFITFINTNLISNSFTELTAYDRNRLTTYYSKILDKRTNNSNHYYYLPTKSGTFYETIYQRQYFDKNKTLKFFPVDCDTGAILYLSIGELFKLPIHLVEIPNHNFVRLYYENDKYINWDNNTAQEITDQEYMDGLSRTSSSTFTYSQRVLGGFLKDMNEKGIIAYYNTLLAIEFEKQNEFKKAEYLYKKALKIRPNSTLVMNNLAYLYLTNKQLNTKKNIETALKLSRKVINIEPHDYNNLDTYACACSAIGDFENAILIEKSGNADYKRIRGYRNKKTCLDMK